MRTKDLKHWERLENLSTLHSPQQRNVVLHPEFIDGKYAFYRPMDSGAGAVPIKTERGWIHISHGVCNTAAGLRHVIYAFATALDDPAKVIAEPSGLLIDPMGRERVGDVSNVAFTNGTIVNEKDEVFIYYAASDTRTHVATTTLDRLTDYVFNTPADPGRSVECVAQRCGLIGKNLEFLQAGEHAR